MDNLVLPAVKAPVLFYIGDFGVTNTLMGGIFVLLTVIVLVFLTSLFVKKEGVPTKFQLVLESLYSSMLNFIDKITGSRKLTISIFPVIGTVLVYVGLSNTILSLPIVDVMQYNGETLFRPHTSDYNTTVGIALGIVVWSHFLSIRVFNPIGHILKFLKLREVVAGFRKGFRAGLMSLVDVFIGILDIVSEFAKVVSLSARLFGNMFAGLMLSAILFAVIPVGFPAILVLYGLFSGIIQALVFGALSASYITMSVDNGEK